MGSDWGFVGGGGGGGGGAPTGGTPPQPKHGRLADLPTKKKGG